jgi:hypothetical protein
VKDVHKGFEVAADFELFGRLARAPRLGANGFVDEIHDINGLIELRDFQWHNELPSQQSREWHRTG